MRSQRTAEFGVMAGGTWLASVARTAGAQQEKNASVHQHGVLGQNTSAAKTVCEQQDTRRTVCHGRTAREQPDKKMTTRGRHEDKKVQGRGQRLCLVSLLPKR